MNENLPLPQKYEKLSKNNVEIWYSKGSIGVIRYANSEYDTVNNMW